MADANPSADLLRETAAQIRDLLEGRLDVDVTPANLFDVPIVNDEAVEVEATRLAAMLQQFDDSAKSGSAKATRAARTLRLRWAQADGGAAYGEARPIDPDIWLARVELDRATLRFLGLPKERRDEILAGHAEQQAAAARARAERPPTDAELAADEQERERQKVLEEARLARADAERRVVEEDGRLGAVGKEQTAFDASLAKQRRDLAERRDTVIAWQRRASEARAQSGPSRQNPDNTYDDLRKTLRSARSELSAALDEASAPSAVPSAGSDPLTELQVDVDTTSARNERSAVENEARRLQGEERRLREQRTAQLLDEIHVLNEERLALQRFLSAEKRDAITGLGTAGIDQAASEVRQLGLVLRYHRHATANWLVSLRRPNQALGPTLARSAFTLLQWLFAVGIFVAWRRRAPSIIENLRQRVEEQARGARVSEPTLFAKAIGWVQQVRRPIEWMTLLACLAWLLPSAARELLEVQLLLVILSWTFTGSFVVNALNALAGASAQVASTAQGDASALRLRSLRLVGHVVVVLGLVLVITSRLVGKGTLYGWVGSICWIASIPVFLVLVRWWRDTVFLRTESARKKSTFEKWLLDHRTGWKSFPAAMVGGVYLFVYGSWRAVRNWIGRFDVTRRVLAYLFRRELDKLVEEQSMLHIEDLPDLAFAALGPERRSGNWIATGIDDRLSGLVARLRATRGGVVALVGERGMGKSHFLHRVAEQVPDVVNLEIASADKPDFRRALLDQLHLPLDTTLHAAAQRLNLGVHGPGLLLDGAEHFVRPAMGGLALFDEVMAAARPHSARFTWVLAFDEVIWQFLERARGARPLFDEVIRLERWREEEIAQLLRQRSAEAEVVPNFDLLLDRLPANADELDKQDALALREAGYYRLVWDYAAGNPGAALHTWRRSLGAGSGGSIYVKLFQTLDPRDLEMLPDSAVFVLRAVLQLAPAVPDAISGATMLRVADVADALRYALGRGYVEERAGGYVVSWTWFRPITRFLQRRHLLVAGGTS